MKNFSFLIVIFLLLPTFSFSQTKEISEFEKLNQQVSALYQQSKFEEAITIAEKIVEIQEKDKKGNLSDLATALKNLAILQKSHDKQLGVKLSDSSISKSDRSNLIVKKVKYYDSIPLLFERAIKIYEEELKSENLSLADIKIEYASYISLDQKTLPGMGIVNPDKVEHLYKDSLSIRKKLLGDKNDLTLLNILQIANFYQKDGEFEKSLPFYRNFIKEIETKYSDKSQYLLQPLRAYLQIVTAAKLEQELENIREKISKITGKPETSEFDLDLTLRNKDNKVEELMKNPNTITGYLKKMKFLLVEVVINENGEVIEAKAADTQDIDIKKKNVQEKAEKTIRNWRFEPFIYDGKERGIKGIVWFPYFTKA